VYYGVGWRKKFKSPTDFCFAIKHPRLQQPKSSKYIKFLCAEDQASLDRWVMGIRLAKVRSKLTFFIKIREIRETSYLTFLISQKH
jgi:amyloid beta A4 precursor protein-binding family B protein 1-interacting protein